MRKGKASCERPVVASNNVCIIHGNEATTTNFIHIFHRNDSTESVKSGISDSLNRLSCHIGLMFFCAQILHQFGVTKATNGSPVS